MKPNDMAGLMISVAAVVVVAWAAIGGEKEAALAAMINVVMLAAGYYLRGKVTPPSN